jgi:hypothetical protein
MSEENTQHLPTQDTPEPPLPKPTLASMIVDKMSWQEMETGRLRDDVNSLFVKIAQTLAQARPWLFVACVGYLLSVLLNIVLIVLVSVLVGHVK